MSRRDERRRIRRDELLDAALEIVAEQGLEGLSVQALAGRTGRSVGAMYRYFPSLEAVLVALQCRVLSELGDRLEAAASRASGAPGAGALAPILEIATAYQEFGLRRPHHFGLLSSILADPRSLLSEEDAGVVGAAMQRLLAVVEEAIQRGQDAGALSAGCPRERCLLLWVSTQGLLQLRKLGRLEPRLQQMDQLLDALLRTLLLGWGASVEQVDDAFDDREGRRT